MLLANSSNGQCINLAETWKKDELEKLRDMDTFQCPVCNKDVILKLGTKRIWHFSHISGTACGVDTEPESTYHLLGKRQLYQWLSTRNVTPELERYFPLLKQRPDLYLPGLSTAIEYQCATIPIEIFNKRNHTLQNAGIEPIWILGSKRLSRIKNTRFYRMDELAFQSLRFNDRCDFSPYILYYCPLSLSFTFLHSIVPYTSRTILACKKTISSNQIVYPFHANELEPPNLKDFHTEWIVRSITTRLYIHLNKDPSVMMMKKHLMKKGIPVSLFPIEAGLPSKHLFWFNSPAYVWQTCFLIEILLPISIDSTFSFRQIFHKFIKTIKFYKISTRPNLADEQSHISYALMDYMQWLCKFGVLRRVDVNHFMKKKELKFPESITDVRKTLKQYFKIQV
ncbi:competence protein CoiA [Bacillus sp. Marseille-Q3570]|uniref:competence protein CoiA n=1 Tax=Bacillus sp. Marseille-Q3570 TaxID=2963522 RepID=UPI0021B7F359|nr:competence protein CoiA family protein [Bacillus sp. Marseille-Q3570]